MIMAATRHKSIPRPDWPAFMSRETAAAYLDISPSTFDLHVRPQLTAIQFGGAPRFSRAELHDRLDVVHNIPNAQRGDDRDNPWDDRPCASD